MRVLLRVCLCLLLAATAPVSAATSVDVALVLAVDTSGSIDAEEFDLQRAGYAAAFRDPRVVDAIQAGSHGAIAVTCFQWAGPRLQQQTVDWTIIRDGETARGFAGRVGAAPRQIAGGGTSISGAIDYAVALFEKSGVEARRRVIDISGDGSNNMGRLAIYARDDAVARGITINGLAILSEEPLLDVYYQRFVIGGSGSFVMAAADYDTFSEAILAKLIREIAALRTD
jgi:Protein of unknown function (DUF1194)